MSMCIARALESFKCDWDENGTLSLEFGCKITGLLSSGMCRVDGREKSLNG